MNIGAKDALVIELRGVSKWFTKPQTRERIVAVERMDLVVSKKDASFVVLLGPSGCGKTTILQLISGLLIPDQGEVHICNKPVTGPNPNTVTVPQAYTCFPWLTVLGNVEFGLRVRGYSKSDRRRAAIEYLNKVGLGDRLEAYPKELSGGMQQRVAIARTLALKPPAMLMDEPFGAPDAQTRAEMQGLLLELWRAENNVVIFVTHDIAEALLLADRVIILSSRPARIIHEERLPFERPRNLHDPEFLAVSDRLLRLLQSPTRANMCEVTGQDRFGGGARQ